MDTKQFYVTLPSNSQETNTAATFVTNLPRQIALTGDWDVGLSEIIYANTWHNVAEEQNMIQFYDLKNNVRIKMLIPRARYLNIHDLVKTISEGIKMVSLKEKFEYMQYFGIKYDENRKFCHLTINTEYIRSVKLTKHLMYMLGFLESQLSDINYTVAQELIIAAHHSPDMLGGMHNFYVYCDIVEPQIVGNVFAPLLQVVNIEGKYMDIVNHAYITPHYIPVLKKSFNTIEVNIKSDQDKPVPFEFGKTIVKLHFRRQ